MCRAVTGPDCLTLPAASERSFSAGQVTYWLLRKMHTSPNSWITEASGNTNFPRLENGWTIYRKFHTCRSVSASQEGSHEWGSAPASAQWLPRAQEQQSWAEQAAAWGQAPRAKLHAQSSTSKAPPSPPWEQSEPSRFETHQPGNTAFKIPDTVGRGEKKKSFTKANFTCIIFLSNVTSQRRIQYSQLLQDDFSHFVHCK